MNHGLFKSTNAGASWKPSNAGLGGLGSISGLVIDPDVPRTIYTAINEFATPAQMGGSQRMGGVAKSVDGGGSWTLMNAGLPVFINAIALDRHAPTTIYAATANDGVFKSTNGGVSWGSTVLAARDVYAIAVDPHARSTVYAASRSSGVFKSTDAGARWNAANAGLVAGSDMAVMTLVLDPQVRGTLYAGTETRGVFKSTDGGMTWHPSSAGMTPVR